MVGGCANTTLKTENARHVRKIKVMTGELGLLREKNSHIARERNQYRDKYQSRQAEIDAVKTGLRSSQQLIAELRSQKTAAAAQAARKPKVVVKRPTQKAVSSGKGQYHLRIISLPKNSHNRKVVQQIASHLRSRGIQSVVPRESGKFWVIDIGGFESIRTAETRKLRSTLRSMKYKGIRQFRDAIYVPY
ncbi:hypothetical protein JYT84_00710 [bacterium AH-315-M10]|nr:hypothetical protein [bacterium AH-315-M10]